MPHTGFGGLRGSGATNPYSPFSPSGLGNMPGIYSSPLPSAYTPHTGYPVSPVTPGITPIIPPTVGTFPAAAGAIASTFPAASIPGGTVVHTSSAGFTAHPDDIEASGFFNGMGAE